MALTPGSRIGSYEITAQIGVGGMGEVYQATDTKLKRQVAIKVLPEAVAADAERLARFQREAEVLASLNHPNIAAIHGLEDADGSKALVMELVQGPTLADRIAQGAIPVDEVLPIARQIAEALEAAHEQGIIHRDLKPANIKVRSDGTVKVLDFGLAKAYEVAGSQDRTHAPTLTTPAHTMQGTLLGTAAYMSPEQAGGGEIDQRSDIWAFGVTLYEMLTGQRLFDGDSVSRVIAKVLERELDFAALPPRIPPAIRRLLRRCLQRDTKRRLHDIADARLEIDAALVEDEPVAPGVVRSERLPVVSWAFGALILAAVTGLTVWAMTRQAPAALTLFEMTASPDAPLGTGPTGYGDLAISPDGTKIVYASGVTPGSWQLHLRRTDQLDTTALRGAEAGAASPFFSPDGGQVGFTDFSDGALKQVSVLGGPATTITSLGNQGVFAGASWGSDDTIVYGRVQGGLGRVPARGGEPEELTTPDTGAGVISHRWPDVLPNGRGALFTLWSGSTANSRIAVVSFDTGAVTELVSGGSHPRYASTGHIVYAVDGTLRAVAFDQDRLVLRGSPAPVIEEVITKEATGAAGFAVADNGSLVYLRGGDEGVAADRTVLWVDRSGAEQPIDLPPRGYMWVRVSPDGSRLAAELDDGDIWVSSVARPALTRLDADPALDYAPLWTPDSQRIVFSSRRDNQSALYWKRADGTGETERLLTLENVFLLSPEGWSADGRRLLVTHNAGGTIQIGAVTIEGDDVGQLETVIDRQAMTAMLAVAPGGNWFAYESNDAGDYEVFVERFPGLGGREVVSTEGGGWAPVWAPDGNELFYRRRSDGAMMVAEMSGADTLIPGRPRVLFERSYWRDERGGARTFDLAPDGDRFLMIREGARDDNAAEPRFVIAEHWFEELKRLVPTD